MSRRKFEEREAQRYVGRGGMCLADKVAVEEPLEIRVNGEPFAVTMRTPGDDPRLAVGFLFAEGIVKSLADVGSVAHCGRVGEEGFGNVIDVVAAGGVHLDVERVQTSRRGTLVTAACGVCGRRQVDDLLGLCGRVEERRPIPLTLLASATARLTEAQPTFEQTGGVHAAAALGWDGALLASYEDIGRHNAVDKVVGALLYAGLLGQAAVLAVSGRASFEIVQKAVMARIPAVASVSAASTLAIDVAERSNVTLASFVRGGNLNVYSHPERLAES